MSRPAWLAAAALVAVPGAASAKEQPKPRYGGTVVIAFVGEPSSLNLILDPGAGSSAFVVALQGGYKIAPDLT